MLTYHNKKLHKITYKILIFFILISAIFAISISTFIVDRFRDNIKAFYGDIGTKIGKFLMSQIDNNKVNYYVRTREPDNYYTEVEEIFKNTKEEFDVAMLYLLVPIDEGILYIWDVGYEDPDAFGIDDYSVYDNDIRLSGTEHIEIANYKVATGYEYVNGEKQFIYEDKTFATVLVPCYFENEEIEYYIGIDFDMKDVNYYIIDFAIKEILIVLLVFSVLTILMILFVKFSVSVPLTNISQRLKETVNNNNFSSSILSDIPTDSMEISNISKSLTKMSEIIEKYHKNIIKNLLDDTQANFAISTMRDFKSETQLPQSIYYDEDRRYNLCVHMEKVDQDNKDYYDYFDIDDDKTAFVIMESSEKSEAFALTLDAISKYIKNKSIQGENIGHIFTNLSKFLHMADWVGIYVNCCEIIIDFSTGEVQYVNAGLINSAMYIKKNDSYQDLPFERENALSAVEDPVYYVNHLKLDKGDKVLLYTSKLNEVLSLKEDDYSSKEIVKYMNKNKDLSIKELFEKMKDTMVVSKNNKEVSDMIFMLIDINSDSH